MCWILFHLILFCLFDADVVTLSDGSGSIDREEFLQIPQIANNPLASRLIAIFDEECVVAHSFISFGVLKHLTHYFSGGGTVDFQEFVGGLSAFSSRGGREEKLRCMCFHDDVSF